MSSRSIELEDVKTWLDAAATGDIATFQKHLDSGFGIEYKAPYPHGFERDGFRSTAPALVVASQYGQLEAVQFLLDQGANVDNRN